MNRLQKRSHRDVALLEDVLVRILYGLDSTIEIHGGTAIWRCYGGRRFSKDIDVYVASKEKWQAFKEKVGSAARAYNAEVLKLKDTGHLIYIELMMTGIYSEIDINYLKYFDKPVLRRYENLDGTFYDVLTLPPEVLIREKISAYKDRKSLTDLYDMRVLADFADMKIIGKELGAFASSIEKPTDLQNEEKRLRDLIFDGPVPSFNSLLAYIRGKVK